VDERTIMSQLGLTTMAIKPGGQLHYQPEQK